MKKVVLLATMAAHFAAFQAKAAAVPYEKRDEPTLRSVTEAIDRINTAFTEYKRTNDERIEAIKSGKSTAEFDVKLARMDEALDSLSEQKSRLEKLEGKMARPGAMVGGDVDKKESPEAIAYKGAFLAWMRNPSDPERRDALYRRGKELKKVETRAAPADDDADWAQYETRSTQTVAGTNSAGGYAVPKTIEQQIARLSVDISPIRQIATVRQVGTTDYHELFDLNGASFEWLGEGDTRNQGNTPDLAEVVPTFGMASAKPQASEESLDDLFFNVEDWLVSSASEAIGQGEGAAFIGGNGTKKPTGFFGRSDAGDDC
ncbi:phage major capsid protein [Massilia phosphatilytica]